MKVETVEHTLMLPNFGERRTNFARTGRLSLPEFGRPLVEIARILNLEGRMMPPREHANGYAQA